MGTGSGDTCVAVPSRSGWGTPSAEWGNIVPRIQRWWPAEWWPRWVGVPLTVVVVVVVGAWDVVVDNRHTEENKATFLVVVPLLLVVVVGQ